MKIERSESGVNQIAMMKMMGFRSEDDGLTSFGGLSQEGRVRGRVRASERVVRRGDDEEEPHDYC